MDVHILVRTSVGVDGVGDVGVGVIVVGVGVGLGASPIGDVGIVGDGAVDIGAVLQGAGEWVYMVLFAPRTEVSPAPPRGGIHGPLGATVWGSMGACALSGDVLKQPPVPFQYVCVLNVWRKSRSSKIYFIYFSFTPKVWNFDFSIFRFFDFFEFYPFFSPLDPRLTRSAPARQSD